MLHAAIRSLAVTLPERRITNDALRARHPTIYAEAERHALGKLWQKPPADSPSKHFDEAMAPFLNDPVRGCVSRHWLRDGETALSLEVDAARRALAAAKLDVGDIDLCLCGSFFPDQCDVGNGAFLARELGLGAPAWNLESACSGSNAALQTAASIVAGGLYRRVLVVVSCTYSRISPEDDTLSWMNGDGAAAFVVTEAPAPFGVVAAHGMSTHETCGSIWSTFDRNSAGQQVIRLHTGAEAGRLLRERSEPMLRTCVDGALSKAGMRLSDIDLFVANTPIAWFSRFACAALGLDPQKTVNAHPDVANVGPVLLPANLALAVEQGKLREGMTLLLYSFGSVSSATACVLRTTDIALAPRR